MATEIVTSSTKITDRKLLGKKNYIQWKRIIRRYVSNIDMGDHLIKDPPEETEDDSKIRKRWLMEDDKLFNQIQNTLDSFVDDVIGHCDTIKELWEYLEFLYASKQDLSHAHELLLKIYRVNMQEKTLLEYYTEIKQAFEEKRAMFPVPTDVKMMQAQEEQVVVQCFLSGLRPEYEIARTQLLTDETLPSLTDVFASLLRVSKGKDRGVSKDKETLKDPNVDHTALASMKSGDSKGNKGTSRDPRNNRGNDPRTCFHCGAEGHVKKNCWKLHGKPLNMQDTQKFAHVVTQDGLLPTPSHVTISAVEYARLTQNSCSQSSIPSTTTTLTQLSNPTACLSTSSINWVIDSGAIHYMTGDTGILSSLHLLPICLRLP
ncbi:hypothetical protein Patl1_02734 [Pistacia atlantica]|uniref:Uncharacterized protein n=1 Tax=Pistacia atlantica TaxID=434234 RepID=A0ACC1C8D4_9ROSI|nr:hypothetical protein Patl1_02734 [Pistacia atlantica]